MADSSPVTVTDDEIQAAIAEIEAMSPDEAAAIPGPDDSSGDVPHPREQRSPTEPAPSNAAASSAPPEQADHAGRIAQRVGAWASRLRDALSGALPRLRTVLRRKSDDTLPAETPQQPAATEEEQVASVADALPAEGICRLVDQALDTLNGPFARFSSGVRRAIGLAAIVTVVISIAALLVFPRVMPHRDALSFLREKRAQLDARPNAPAPPESPTGSNDSPRS